MEYLPSKIFVKRFFIVLLVASGWFYLSSIKDRITAPQISEDNGENSNANLVIVAKKTSPFEQTSSLTKIDKWSGLYKENSGTKTNVSTAKTAESRAISALPDHRLTDIASAGPATKESLNKYGNDLRKAIEPYTLEGLPNEPLLMLNGFSDSDGESFEKIKLMSQVHETISGMLLTMSVPEELRFAHLSLVNGTAGLRNIDVLMAGMPSDPDEAEELVSKYKLDVIHILNAFDDINKVFTEKGVNFGSSKKIKIYLSGTE